MKNKGKIKVVIATLMVAMAFGAVVPTVNAAQNVDTTWIVPGDTTISASFPTGETEIEFNAGSKTFSDLKATGQGGSTAALKISNDGNQDLSIDMSWDETFPTGITYVNISVGGNDNTTDFSYSNATATSDQTVGTITLLDGEEEYWFWSSAVNATEAETGITRTLVVTSSAA